MLSPAAGENFLAVAPLVFDSRTRFALIDDTTATAAAIDRWLRGVVPEDAGPASVGGLGLEGA